MNTPSDMNSGSSFDLEPDPYRELDIYLGDWNLSELVDAPQRADSTDNSSSGAYFAGRRIKMEAASPDPFPEPRTFPTDWDLSLLEAGQSASQTEEPQSGYSIDWMPIKISTSGVKPVDLDAAK